MKNAVLILVAGMLMIGLSSCWPVDTCGPFPEGYNWEKKDYQFKVPFSLDSLRSDTLNIRLYSHEHTSDTEIVYSDQLDSVAIIVDVQGENFEDKTAGETWKPYYKYYWPREELGINFVGDYFRAQGKGSQNPQCSSAPYDVLTVTKLRIEMPRTLKHVIIHHAY